MPDGHFRGSLRLDQYTAFLDVVHCQCVAVVLETRAHPHAYMLTLTHAPGPSDVPVPKDWTP